MHLPITLVTACVAALILIWLSFRVIGQRVKGEVLIGNGESEDLLFKVRTHGNFTEYVPCLLYTSPSPRDRTRSRMPSSA